MKKNLLYILLFSCIAAPIFSANQGQSDKQKIVAVRKTPSITKDCFFFTSGLVSLGFSFMFGAATSLQFHKVEDEEQFKKDYLESHKMQTAAAILKSAIKSKKSDSENTPQNDVLIRKMDQAYLDESVKLLGYTAASFYSGALGIYLIGKALHLFNSHPEIIEQKSK